MSNQQPQANTDSTQERPLHDRSRTTFIHASHARGLGGAAELYLDLLKRCLTDSLGPQTTTAVRQPSGGVELAPLPLADRYRREEGRDWPAIAETMIGLKRLDNLGSCVRDVLERKVPGDLIETGVWRGGATIFMRAVLKAYGVTDRNVWVADSFEGLPLPNAAKYPADDRDKHHTYTLLRVTLEQVKENFKRYGLLDEQVRFLKGWFRDTLPTLAKQRWAVVRLDGDMYESTMDGLVNLYPNLSVGGYLIVDDYGAIPACRQAVEDFRRAERIDAPIQSIDWTGVFWRRSA